MFQKIDLPIRSYKNTLTEEEQNARYEVIGASDVSAILGLSQYKSPLELYCEKTEKRSNFKGNELTHWGSKIEPILLEDYAERVGRAIHKGVRVVHPRISRFVANLDGVDGKIVIETKVNNFFVWHKIYNLGQKIPSDYMCQVQSQLACSGFEKARLLALVEKELHCFEISRDEEDIKFIEDSVEKFLHLIDTKTPPDATAIDTDYFKDKYPESTTEEVIHIRDDLDIKDYWNALEQSKHWENEVETFKNKVKSMMGVHGYAFWQGNPVTWLNSKDSEFLDPKKIQKDNPELFSQLMDKYKSIRKGGRRFVIKEGKDNG